MGRTRNPRRVALDVMRAIKSNASAMVAWWDHVPSTRYWQDPATGKWTHGNRERKDISAAEYRENNPENWANLAAFMDTIAEQAQSVATYARRQERETRERLHVQAVAAK